MNTPLIRPETPADVPAIHALTVAAFSEAEHASGTEQHIVDALRDAGQLTLSLVAVGPVDGAAPGEDDAPLLGHVAASPVGISDGTAGWYGLGPLSVDPQHQGQGIGSALMRAALAELQRLGAQGCVLLGDPAFYQRFGFELRADLELPGLPPGYFQALKLAGDWPHGAVSYHEAFDAAA